MRIPAAAAVAAFLGLTSMPALSMPNPGETKPYLNHSVEIGLGAEYASQHYASVRVIPKGNGVFDFAIRCENGEPGGATDAFFVVELRAGDEVLHSFGYDCHLRRTDNMFGETGQQVHIEPSTADLSTVIDRVTNVRFLALRQPPRKVVPTVGTH